METCDQSQLRIFGIKTFLSWTQVKFIWRVSALPSVIVELKKT